MITLSELKDRLTSSTSKSYRRQKLDYTKNTACLFCQLNSNQLQCWFSNRNPHIFPQKKHVVQKIEIITAIVTQTWQLCICQYQRMHCESTFNKISFQNVLCH